MYLTIARSAVCVEPESRVTATDMCTARVATLVRVVTEVLAATVIIITDWGALCMYTTTNGSVTSLRHSDMLLSIIHCRLHARDKYCRHSNMYEMTLFAVEKREKFDGGRRDRHQSKNDTGRREGEVLIRISLTRRTAMSICCQDRPGRAFTVVRPDRVTTLTLAATVIHLAFVSIYQYRGDGHGTCSQLRGE